MPKVWIAAPSFAALGHLSPLAADREKIADRPLRESRCRSVLYRPSSLSCDQCPSPRRALFPIEQQGHHAKPPLLVQGLVVDHLMSLKNRGPFLLVVNRGLRCELGNPHRVVAYVYLGME